MTKNIHAAARMTLAAFGFVLLGSACDNPISGKRGGGGGDYWIGNPGQI